MANAQAHGFSKVFAARLTKFERLYRKVFALAWDDYRVRRLGSYRSKRKFFARISDVLNEFEAFSMNMKKFFRAKKEY